MITTASLGTLLPPPATYLVPPTISETALINPNWKWRIR